MFVHLNTRRCNQCGSSSDNSIVDLPIEEIKLHWHPVACPCGYFTQAEHYPVSFNAWKRDKLTLQHNIEDAETNVRIEKRLIEDHSFNSILPELEEKLSKLKEELIELEKNPVHDTY